MKKGTVQVLSFVSGLTLAAVVIGVTISKSPALRGEIESQLSSVLRTTRGVVDAYKSLGSKSKAAINLVRPDSGAKTAEEKMAEAEQNARVNQLWEEVEEGLS